MNKVYRYISIGISDLAYFIILLYATLLHKKSICVTRRLQPIFNATFVAATCCTTLNRLQIPTTLLQQIDSHVTRSCV